MRTPLFLASLVAILLASNGTSLHAAPPRFMAPILLAEDAPAGAADADDADDDDQDQNPTPEEKMERRFPQPVRAGFLIGLPLLDDGDSTIGFIRDVVRTPDEKIKLIVGIGGWFGHWPKRAVAVPLEAVAILARQVDTLDLSRKEIEAEPTWDSSLGKPVDRNEMIRIAITRR
jgi:hypothetical protein